MSKTRRSKLHTKSSYNKFGSLRIYYTKDNGDFKKFERDSCSDRLHIEVKTQRRKRRHLIKKETKNLINEEI